MKYFYFGIVFEYFKLKYMTMDFKTKRQLVKARIEKRKIDKMFKPKVKAFYEYFSKRMNSEQEALIQLD